MTFQALSEKDLSVLSYLRRQLHQHPELSGLEQATAQTIESFLLPSRPTKIIRNLGGHGLAFIYNSGRPGPYIGFRAELDALPIHEENDFSHQSIQPGVSHKCGHDGHMSILAGLGLWLQNNPLLHGRVMLLFQPAEETGQGAEAIIKDARWQGLKPDWLFGLHNIPGFPPGEVFCKDGTFCAASQGMLLKLNGITSHAAEPEKGLNPARALATIMLRLEELPYQDLFWRQQVFATPVFARLGEKAFGTSAGYAEYGLTLRTFNQHDMQQLRGQAERIIAEVCTAYPLSYTITYQEFFPATENHGAATAYVRTAAREAGLPYHELDTAFRWSEDFGWYSGSCPTAFAGLGAGEQQAPLHHPDYDFPDEIIGPGVQLFSGIINDLLFKNKS